MNQSKIDLVMLLPGIVGGGAERVSLNLAKYLLRSGFSVKIICFGSEQNPLAADIDVEILFLKKNGFLQSLIKILFMLNKIRPRFVFSTFSYINITLILVKCFLFPKIICREANLHHKNNVMGWKNNIIYRLLFLYNFADIFLCSSNYMKNHFIREHSIHHSNITVWRNPVDIENIQKLAGLPVVGEKMISSCDAVRVGRRFVAIGRLEPQKNFEQLIEWFVEGSEPDDALLIVGSGTQRASLKDRVDEIGIGCRIELCGHQENPCKILAQCDALLIPSLWEGMPNVALEAIALGIPVLAMRTAGAIEELSRECPLVVVAQDSSDFVSKLSSLDWRAMRSTAQFPSKYYLANSGEAFARLLS